MVTLHPYLPFMNLFTLVEWRVKRDGHPDDYFANSSSVSDYVDPSFQDYLRNGNGVSQLGD